ncbi:MAG: glucose-1-phosphate cytidylyltransferase [Gemmatimonadaceae bacterium]|nr:glucose-1-phosphate cytidylyltransferase [Acetobacteraceae bacterium]
MIRKAVILAGGFGTRLMEETEARPKPMVEIGGRPILWHIMKIYASYGINEFIIPLGYKGWMIKQFFTDYHLQAADLTIDLAYNGVTMLRRAAEPWKVTLVDTGLETMTGGRIRRLREYIQEPFCMTYGDGVATVDINEVAKFHAEHGKLATVTAVRPPSRFGALDIDHGQVRQFEEKPLGDIWINGGFFILSPAVFDLIDGDDTVFEAKPLERLAASGELMAYKHEGFWQSMDTLRDKRLLEDLWKTGNPPWKRW